jgi:hypothetical protein
MRVKALILAAVAGAAICGPALAWTAQNQFQVRDVGNGRFEVQSRGGLSDANAWCAAGDFAIRRLGVSGSTRVWRISPPPRPRGKGITFSLSPDGAAGSTGLATVGGAGNGSRSAISAQGLCANLRENRRR